MMHNSPKITVITVCYNAVSEIECTILSVINQLYTNIEYIIVDGASTDGTLDIIKKYSAKISILISEPDKGIYDAMNKGLRSLDGDYVCFLNAGDFLPSPTIASRIAEMSEKDMPAVMYGDTDIVDSDGNFLRHRRLAPPENLTWKSFRHGMLVCHQAFYARADFAIATPYNQEYRFSADVDWCIRIMKAAAKENVPMLNLHMVVANYTQEGQTTLHHRESLKERYRVMERHYGRVQTFMMHCWFLVRAVFKPN